MKLAKDMDLQTLSELTEETLSKVDEIFERLYTEAPHYVGTNLEDDRIEPPERSEILEYRTKDFTIWVHVDMTHIVIMGDKFTVCLKLDRIDSVIAHLNQLDKLTKDQAIERFISLK